MSRKNTSLKLIQDTKAAFNISVSGMMPFLQRVIDPFLITNPYWGLAIYGVIGLYGVYLALRQDELNELIEFIQKHPNEFKKEIVESEEFRLGFIRFFDSYIKERLKDKRRILRVILLGFVLSEEKEKFDLERLEDALVRISPIGLEQLIFIKNEILPSLKTKVAKNISFSKVNPEDYEKVEDFYWAIESVSEDIRRWFYRKNPNKSLNIELEPTIIKDPNITSKSIITNAKNEDYNNAKESWPELQSLGIFTVLIRTESSNKSNVNSYHLTKFGRNFINYISKEE